MINLNTNFDRAAGNARQVIRRNFSPEEEALIVIEGIQGGIYLLL